MNTTDESTFKYEGTCSLRFENKYFELTLIGDDLRKITHYICGYIVKDHTISIATSESPFVLTDDGLKGAKWYTSLR